jgi:hypothetical protein
MILPSSFFTISSLLVLFLILAEWCSLSLLACDHVGHINVQLHALSAVRLSVQQALAQVPQLLHLQVAEARLEVLNATTGAHVVEDAILGLGDL